MVLKAPILSGRSSGVEHNLAKVGVVSSNLIARSIHKKPPSLIRREAFFVAAAQRRLKIPFQCSGYLSAALWQACFQASREAVRRIALVQKVFSLKRDAELVSKLVDEAAVQFPETLEINRLACGRISCRARQYLVVEIPIQVHIPGTGLVVDDEKNLRTRCAQLLEAGVIGHTGFDKNIV